MLTGEITTRAVVDYAEVVRRVIRDVATPATTWADTCAVMAMIGKQSPISARE